MKRRDDKAWIKDARTILGGPKLAKMLRVPLGCQDVKEIWKKKETGQ